MSAQCIVIYTRDEFNKLFATLNRNKLDFSEICAKKNKQGYALNPRPSVENVVIYKGFKAILCKITLEKNGVKVFKICGD